MARGPYNIPRNTKGEGRFFNIFSAKALVVTVVFALIGVGIFYPIGALISHSILGIIAAVIFGAIGFVISTFKVPESENFELTRKVGGEYIDKAIIRYIKFKKRKNRIYTYTEEKKDE